MFLALFCTEIVKYKIKEFGLNVNGIGCYSDEERVTSSIFAILREALKLFPFNTLFLDVPHTQNTMSCSNDEV